MKFSAQTGNLNDEEKSRVMNTVRAQTNFIVTEGDRVAFEDTGGNCPANALLSMLALSKADTAAILEKTEVPTLVVTGTRSRTLPMRSKKR